MNVKYKEQSELMSLGEAKRLDQPQLLPCVHYLLSTSYQGCGTLSTKEMGIYDPR